MNDTNDTLNICRFSTGNYCLDVLNQLSAQDESLDDSTIIAATRFLARFDGPESVNADRYEWLPILLDNGERPYLGDLTESDSLQSVTPRAMNPETGWQHIFDTPEDCVHLAVLSDGYLEEHGINLDENKLLEFFKQLGIAEKPLPQRKTFRRDQVDRRSYQSKILLHFRHITSTKVAEVVDFLSPRWLISLAEGRKPRNMRQKSTALLKCWTLAK